MKKRVVLLFALFVFFPLSQPSFADAKTVAAEKLFDEDFDHVWDATVAVLKEKGFAVHPHKKMKAKKKRGKIKTPEWRYFKIWSAKPVVEKQYKDSYKLKLTKIEIEVPVVAKADPVAKDGVSPAGEEKDKTASAEPKPSDARAKATETVDASSGEKKDGAAVAAPEPEPVPTITKVKVTINRKFLIHNDATRKWVKADEEKELVGYTAAFLMEAIIEKLKDEKPSVDKTKQANLNINPILHVK